jgi:cytoskeleton protein RodZ
MIEKTNSQRTKGKRVQLGKSFSSILQQSTSQEKRFLSRSEATATSVISENEKLTPQEQISDNSQSPLNAKAIGLILKEKREEKGLTLDNISSNLCLKGSLLKSIEAGDWEDLPHRVYVRGYIRKYANLLGVYSEVMPYLTEDTIQSNAEKTNNKTIERQDKKQLLFILPKKTPKAMLLYAVAITLILAFFLVKGEKKQSLEMSKLENSIQVTNSISENDGKRTIPNFIDTKKLMITCHERTWISVIIDGTEKKEFTLKPQEVVILNAKEKFDLLIGNAGGIKLLLDGKDTNFAGENGQVKRVTLS